MKEKEVDDINNENNNGIPGDEKDQINEMEKNEEIIEGQNEEEKDIKKK